MKLTPMVTLCLLALSFPLRAANADIRGLVKPRDQAIISSEIAARVVRLPFRDGDRFEAGDTLIEFDCALYRAQLDAALAARELRRSEHRNAQQLLDYKAASPLDVEAALNALKQAEADVEIENLKVQGCRIAAPYPGRVVDVMTNAHETVSRGKELLRILSDAQLEVELIIPSSWLGWLEQGDTLQFMVDETGVLSSHRLPDWCHGGSHQPDGCGDCRVQRLSS